MNNPPTTSRLLCRELVGRQAELDALRRRVAAVPAGRGGVVVVVGDAGVGKTRLVREVIDTARAGQATVLSGRAVPGMGPVPYRPLTEAFRSAPPPETPVLAGFGAHLGRLVPAWQGRTPAGTDESPLLLGEAAVRLLAHVGRAGGGSVLVLEDLHWADAETIATVDYLSDATQDEAVLCVCTTRPEGAATDLVDRLARRGPASTLDLTPLDDGDIDRMVGLCLSTATPPEHVADFIRAHAEGNPFLVEELLAGLVASGELRLGDGRWRSEGALTPTVPASLRESIRRRLGALDPTARTVVGAAALLGRRFSWELVPGIAALDGRTVVEGLRAAVNEQLVEVEGSGFGFRHALTREAVLADLLPPERLELAQRAWPALERANPGLPGPVCEQAADLAEAAGQPVEAARRLVESAGRALLAGALTSAEAIARRAQRLAAGDDAIGRDAAEVLVRILVAAGNTAEALPLGQHLVARLAASGAPPSRLAELLVVTGRAALTAGDIAAAQDHVDQARAALGDRVDAALAAPIDALAAHIALDGARLQAAHTLASAAVDAAARTGQPAVECEALEVLGRVARVSEAEASEGWFERAAAVAARHGLAAWHLRAEQELALQAWGRGDVSRLHATRALAARYGALVTVAVMDLSLADIALGDFDRAGSLASARACVDASRRYGLATEPVAHLWLAGAHALAGDDVAMEAAAADALAHDPDDPRILGDLYGRVLASRALIADDLGAMRGHLDTMMGYVRLAPPTTSVFPGRLLWATLRAIDDDDLGAAVRAEVAEVIARVGMVMFSMGGEAIEAVVLGRQGHAAAALERMTVARDGFRRARLGLGLVHTQQVLIARAAIRDGWGEPVAWLREAEAFFAAGGYDRVARRCRTMIGDAGGPVPRRGRGESSVPPSLRALGVTSRELDVLKLVVAGLSNREIGERLFLSPKTVERHLASLFDWTSVRNRAALADVARAHGVESG